MVNEKKTGLLRKLDHLFVPTSLMRQEAHDSGWNGESDFSFSPQTLYLEAQRVTNYAMIACAAYMGGII